MNDEKYYYELNNKETGDSLFCTLDLPVKPELVPEILGIDELGYTARLVTKEYYESEKAD